MNNYKKKNYTMKAEKVAAGTELYNFLEDCKYTTNDSKCIKLIGTVGEVWPVTIEKLAKTYTFIDGTPITADNIPEGEFEIATIIGETADIIFAEQVTEQVQVVLCSISGMPMKSELLLMADVKKKLLEQTIRLAFLQRLRVLFRLSLL